MRGMKYWLWGFFLSGVFIWVASFFFDNSIILFAFDESVGRYTVQPGRVIRWHLEGSARTVVGKHGVPGIRDIAGVRTPKIAVLGDSHVESLYVDDEGKIAQVFTGLCRQDPECGLTGFGIAESGYDIADYYYAIRKYPEVVPGIRAYFIVSAGLEDDFLPADRETVKRFRFSSENNCTFIDRGYELDEKYRFQSYRRLLYSLRLTFVSRAVGKIKRMKDELRFAPGPARDPVKAEAAPKPDRERLSGFWRCLFKKLREETRLPIVIVYLPDVPVIEKGTIVYADREKSQANLLKDILKENDIGFLDLSDRCNDYFRKTAEFPRGFPNIEPSRGHLNAAGQRLAARAIFDHLKEHEFYAD